MAIKPVLSNDMKARLAAVAALKSGLCRCGHAKQTGMAFCFKCWLALPKNVRLNLYRPVGKGFEAAHQVACEFLTLQETKGDTTP